MRACMGGTFDPLHRGHEQLLAEAVRASSSVFVGVASDELAARGRQRRVLPARQRLERVAELLARWGVADRVELDVIDDRFGRALGPGFELIVVSEGTQGTARDINDARRDRALPPLQVHVVPLLLALDGLPISGTRVAAGAIDRDGLRPQRIVAAVGSENPVKLGAVHDALAPYAKVVEVLPAVVDSGVPRQPRNDETVRGAIARARAALEAQPAAGLGVGIEAGLQDDAWSGHRLDVQYCAIADRRGRVTIGHGPGFLHPPRVLDEIERGATVGDAFDRATGRSGVGRTEGAIGVLTHQGVTRRALTAWAVTMALVPRLRPDLYEPAGV